VIASRWPLWRYLLLEIIAWFGLHAIALREITTPMQPISLTVVMIDQMIHGGAMAR
jgi:hypothetical protein